MRAIDRGPQHPTGISPRTMDIEAYGHAVSYSPAGRPRQASLDRVSFPTSVRRTTLHWANRVQGESRGPRRLVKASMRSRARRLPAATLAASASAFRTKRRVASTAGRVSVEVRSTSTG